VFEESELILILTKYVMDSTCIDKLASLSVHKNSEEFYEVDSAIDTKNCMYISKVRLNFYQMWYLFRCIPRVYPNGKSGLLRGLQMYEFCFRKNKEIFILYGWGNEILKVKNWSIGTNTDNPLSIKHFMETLFDMVQCYSKHYKCMESNTWHSDNVEAHVRLQAIKKELVMYRDHLKSM
jgi:hypothetical protein